MQWMIFFRRPAVILILFSTFWWLLSLQVFGVKHPFSHSPYDQHTRQAMAWWKGQLYLSEAPGYLEIATYNGHHYNSFPPTPSLIEFTLVPFFGQNTPTHLLIFVFGLASILMLYRLGRSSGLSKMLSCVLAIWFVLGSNQMLSLSMSGVWSLGQVMGFTFALAAFLTAKRMSFSQKISPAWAYFLLSLAVGCRPFYFFAFPFLAALDRSATKRSVRQVFRDFCCFALPYLGLLAGYNYLRFHNAFEFGHNFLPWYLETKHEQFSVQYLARNAYHALLRLPSIGRDAILCFHGRGTAFWLNNSCLLAGLVGLFSRSKEQQSVKRTAGLALLLIGLGLLSHESNGWWQFGYRYAIDLMPIAAIFSPSAIKVESRVRISILLVVVILSLIINLYGVWWFSMLGPC